MPLQRIRAVYARGGTSKGIIFRRSDLPEDARRWDALFLRIMGSPDPNRRQLDGMGGGISSLSKVCIVGPSSRPDADVDYTFAQVSIADAMVDYDGNCGNMSSAIGPFAVEEGLVGAPADGDAVVRIHNTNTAKIIVARFPVEDGAIRCHGDMAIDGVAGTAAPVRLEFVDPGGAKTGRLLPTGHALDRLRVPEVGEVEASLVDAANPCVFIDAATLGMTGAEAPDVLDQDGAFGSTMEAVRRAASVAMGIGRDAEAAGRIQSVPKVAIVAAPRPMRTLAGRRLEPADMAIAIRMISMGQAHRAVPITGALCLAVAARIPGSVPHRLATASAAPIRVAHPSGVTVVDAKVVAAAGSGQPSAEYGAVYRTTRRLFEGSVLCRDDGGR